MKTNSRAPLRVLLTITALTGLAHGAFAQGVTTWSGAGADLNWSTVGNWTTSGGSIPPGAGDTAVFGNGAFPASTNAVGSVNNIVTASTTLAGLSYLNVSPNTHTTQIDPGQTLTVNGTVTVGVASSTTVVTMVGTGNFTVNNITGKFNVGGNGGSTETVTLTLADGTNTINAQTLSLGESASNNGRQCIINLGAGTNIINADSVNMGTGKGSGNVAWPAATATGGLTIRDHTGTGRATVLLGNGTSGSGSSNGRLLLSGHPADILASTLTLGKLGNDTGTQIGVLTFDNGTVDATSVLMGVIPATGVPSGNGKTGPSTLNVGGDTNIATLIVNSPSGPGSGSFIISDSVNAVTTHTSSGTVNINPNGIARVYCSMTKAQAALNTATININGGTLNMEAATNTIGTPAIPIDGLSLSNATLQLFENGSSLNAAVGALTVTATNLLNIGSLPVISSLPTVLPIISYASFGSTDGDPSNLVLGPLPGSYTGYLTNDNSSTVSLVITNGPIFTKAVQWGGSANNNWDIASLNWTNLGVVVKYAEGDFVTFDDAGKTNIINLTGARTPGSLTVNNTTLNYTFSGPGAINGLTSLIKSGNGSLTLAESGGDGFAGGITVHGGTLVLDNPNSAIPGALTNDASTVVQVGNNDGNGVLPAGFLQINGSLVFNQASNRTVAATISGSGSVTKIGTNTLTLTGVNAYTGTTTVSNGTLVLSGSGSISTSPLTSVRNAALDITTATSPSLNTLSLSNATFNVGSGTNTPTVATLNASNSMITLVADYGNVGGAAILATTSLTTGGTTNTINVTAIRNLPLSPTLPFNIPLISYSSATFNGGFNFGWTNLPGLNGYITNNTANNSVDLVITGAPQNITWNGGSATGNNWSDAANWSGTAISALDALTFDGSVRINNTNDTPAGTTYAGMTFNAGAAAFTLNGAPVNLTGTTVNNSANIQTVNLGLVVKNGFTLDGGIAGGALAINGGVTNTVATGQTVTLLGIGTLSDLWATNSGALGGGQLQFELGNAGGEWTILDGTGSGTLIQAGNVQLNLNSGVAGGTLDFGTTNSAPNVDAGFTNGSVTLNGNTGTFNMNNGTLRTSSMSIGSSVNGYFNMNGGTLILGSGSLTAGGGVGASIFTATITNGSVFSTNGGNFTIAQRGSGSVTMTGGLLQCGTLNLTTGTAAGGNGTVNLSGGSLICTNMSVGSTAANGWGLVNFNGGTLKLGASSAAFFRQNNLVPLTNIVQAGGAIIDSAGFNTAFTFPLLTDPNLGGTPDGGLIKLGAGTLTLSAANSYIGDTLVGGGTLMVNGSLAASAVTVSNNATLGGSGTIGSNVTVNAGGTLSPGVAVGTLTVNGNVTLGGTNIMDVDKVAGTHDLLLATSTTDTTIAYGGTLKVTITGTIVSSDTFKLFSATNYSGVFASIAPSIPGPGLGWNTNTLATDGILRIVTTVNTTPTNLTAVVSGNQLNLSWPADHTGWRLQAQTNSSGTGLTTNWVDVAGSTTVNAMSFPINPANGSVFFRMRYP